MKNPEYRNESGGFKTNSSPVSRKESKYYKRQNPISA